MIHCQHSYGLLNLHLELIRLLCRHVAEVYSTPWNLNAWRVPRTKAEMHVSTSRLFSFQIHGGNVHVHSKLCTYLSSTWIELRFHDFARAIGYRVRIFRSNRRDVDESALEMFPSDSF